VDKLALCLSSKLSSSIAAKVMSVGQSDDRASNPLESFREHGDEGILRSNRGIQALKKIDRN
jgi:hypothetical protein